MSAARARAVIGAPSIAALNWANAAFALPAAASFSPN